MSWDCVSKHLGSLEVILNQSPDQSLFVLHVWSSIDNAENDPGDWLWRKKCLHCPDYWCLSASLKGLVLTGATSSLCIGVGIKTISLQRDELLLSSSYLTVVSTITVNSGFDPRPLHAVFITKRGLMETNGWNHTDRSRILKPYRLVRTAHCRLDDNWIRPLGSKRWVIMSQQQLQAFIS